MRRTSVRTLLAAATAVAALAATSACGGPASGGPAPSGPATTTPAASPSAAPAGTAYFLATSGEVTSLTALRDGRVTTVASLPPDTGRCSANTLTVSPDGKFIAWVKGNGSNPDTGALVLADIDGGHPRQLTGRDVSCLGPTAIRWSGPNGIEVRTVDGHRAGFTVPAGTRSVGDPGQETDDVWSVTDSAIAARDEHGQVYVGAIDGGPTLYPIRYTPPAAEAAHWDGWSPRSVSLDARYLAVGWNGTDPSRRDDSFAILDVTTSKPVALPEPAIGHAEFLADGTVLVQAPNGTKLDILDGRFRLVRSVPLPAEVTDLRLIRYVG